MSLDEVNTPTTPSTSQLGKSKEGVKTPTTPSQLGESKKPDLADEDNTGGLLIAIDVNNIYRRKEAVTSGTTITEVIGYDRRNRCICVCFWGKKAIQIVENMR